jgi:Na+/H+ antiporter NhaD/arsenite permease-like protein
MFVMVEGLFVTGWIDHLAVGLSKAGSLGSAIMLMGLLSIVLANMINNQPMTILFTEVCMSPHYTAALGTKTHLASLFSLVVGSNLVS